MFTSADIDMVIDVNGYNPSGASFVAPRPERVLDTRLLSPRPTPATSSLFRPVRVLTIAGGAGVPHTAGSVVINLTVTGSTTGGFATVYPCGSPTPNTSNINFVAAETVSNLVVADVSDQGTICLFSTSNPEYVVDLVAYHP